MAIKDLLVAYNDDEGARNALKFGLQMAKKLVAVPGSEKKGGQNRRGFFVRLLTK